MAILYAWARSGRKALRFCSSVPPRCIMQIAQKVEEAHQVYAVLQPVGSRPTTSVASGPFQPYGSTFDQLPDARVRNGSPFTLFALNKKSMPASGFETFWAQAQPNDSKQTVWEPWNQYMYRNEPIRANLQVSQKAPKVLGDSASQDFVHWGQS